MQGFNKYYPPDFDPEVHGSLNAYHGKHALGDRARKISQGVLITRFELPFNIWCLNCNNHIGMGVRYNAEKRKIGMYFSTPIFAFRCKCHLCSGWFEIRTDPKNTRYVVESGARQKIEDWNPEENGGFAIHDTTAADTPPDPLASLEKTTAAQTLQKTVVAPRIDELLEHSDRVNSDPYTHSKRMRKFFREEKKIEKAKMAADNQIKDRYGLPKELKLIEESELSQEAKEEWEEASKMKVVNAAGSGGASSSSAGSSSSTSKPPATFAEARKLGASLPSAPSRGASKLSTSSRQTSTLSAVLLRNTIRNAAERKRPPDTKSLGILKK